MSIFGSKSPRSDRYVKRFENSNTAIRPRITTNIYELRKYIRCPYFVMPCRASSWLLFHRYTIITWHNDHKTALKLSCMAGQKIGILYTFLNFSHICCCPSSHSGAPAFKFIIPYFPFSCLNFLPSPSVIFDLSLPFPSFEFVLVSSWGTCETLLAYVSNCKWSIGTHLIFTSAFWDACGRLCTCLWND